MNTYYGTDSIVNPDDFYIMMSGRSAGKTWAEMNIRMQRIDTIRGKVLELSEDEMLYLLSDFYNVYDYLLERLKYSETERFKNERL